MKKIRIPELSLILWNNGYYYISYEERSLLCSQKILKESIHSEQAEEMRAAWSILLSLLALLPLL